MKEAPSVGTATWLRSRNADGGVIASPEGETDCSHARGASMAETDDNYTRVVVRLGRRWRNRSFCRCCCAAFGSMPVKVDAAALAVIRSLPVRHRELGPEWRGSLSSCPAAVKERRNGGGRHNSYLKTANVDPGDDRGKRILGRRHGGIPWIPTMTRPKPGNGSTGTRGDV